MPLHVYVIFAAGWLVWLLPFLLRNRRIPRAQQLDRRARWGVAIQSISYALLWQHPFWNKGPADWRVALSILFFIIGSLFSWTSVRTLGRQWRIDAGLNADHQLVQSGPYRLVRHPIYTSMLCLLLGMGFLVSPMWMLGVALLVLIIGTQIRVRIEERLLAGRFGEEFSAYRRRVPAYVPFLKLSGGVAQT